MRTVPTPLSESTPWTQLALLCCHGTETFAAQMVMHSMENTVPTLPITEVTSLHNINSFSITHSCLHILHMFPSFVFCLSKQRLSMLCLSYISRNQIKHPEKKEEADYVILQLLWCQVHFNGGLIMFSKLRVYIASSIQFLLSHV